MVNITTQTFAGNKTFTGTLTVASPFAITQQAGHTIAYASFNNGTNVGYFGYDGNGLIDIVPGEMLIYPGSGTSVNIAGGTGSVVLSLSTAGKMVITDGSQGTAGQVWTSTDTAGTGHWGNSPQQPTRQVLTSGTTYTRPAGVVFIKVTMVGGGAQGGGVATAASTSAAGAGGGAGGTCIVYITSPSSTYSMVIGVGGSTTAAGNSTGQNGTASTFNAGTYSAGGGGGGGGSAANGGIALGQSGGGAGGTSSGGDLNITGGPGQIGWNPSNGLTISGIGGYSTLGAPGSAQGNQNATGSSGTGYGAGGNGGLQVNNGGAQKGGNGANGVIIVDEYY
jgi:hypothetical protein